MKCCLCDSLIHVTAILELKQGLGGWALKLCAQTPPFKFYISALREQQLGWKISMSQSCRAYLFFSSRLIQQNSCFYFFFCLLNFFPVSKYTWKDMPDIIKHFEQQTFFNSVLCLNCILFIQKSSSIFHTEQRLWSTQIWHVCCWGDAFRSGLPICHKLWDRYFFLALCPATKSQFNS